MLFIKVLLMHNASTAGGICHQIKALHKSRQDSNSNKCWSVDGLLFTSLFLAPFFSGSPAFACNVEVIEPCCRIQWRMQLPRPDSVSVSEFGAVGNRKTLNNLAFQNAIFYLQSFADKGGAQLYVPAGRWLNGTINLISHLTHFLEKNAIILGSQLIILKHRKFLSYALLVWDNEW